jgi:hypothetical protein
MLFSNNNCPVCWEEVAVVVGLECGHIVCATCFVRLGGRVKQDAMTTCEQTVALEWAQQEQDSLQQRRMQTWNENTIFTEEQMPAFERMEQEVVNRVTLRMANLMMQDRLIDSRLFESRRSSEEMMPQNELNHLPQPDTATRATRAEATSNCEPLRRNVPRRRPETAEEEAALYWEYREGEHDSCSQS